MNKHFNIKVLMTITFFGGFSGLLSSHSIKISKDQNRTAPKVSAVEAKMSFWDMPYLQDAFINTKPELRKDGIPVNKLEKSGANKAHIIKLAKAIANKKHGLIDSLLIAHKDELVFESYYLRGRVDLPHMQASSTKSYVSLAIGRAIQLGYLTMADLNEPVINFLKDLDTSKLIQGAEKITLNKALTMRSGMRISREQLKAFNNNPKQLKGQGQIQMFLENSPVISSKSQEFKYTNTDPMLAMQVLDVVVPGSAKDFIKRELLDKMGIVIYEWKDDVSGLPMAPYRSSMTSRNMFKWGKLISNKGKWNGEQLISESYITKATKRIVQPKADETFFVNDNVTNPGYGYYFWQADMKVGNKNYFSISAQGGGGQYIVMIEELDLILVTTAHEREDKTMQIIAEQILPAFVQ